jgi:protein TonB
MLRFIVNEKGRVKHINIIKSHPRGIFEDAVINCVSKWRFKPATVEGIKVKTLVETTIRFKLK